MSALLSRLRPAFTPTLSVADTAALIRTGTGARLAFSAVSAAVAAPLTPWMAIGLWFAFVVFWELVGRPQLDALALSNGARADAALAAVNVVGASGYTAFAVLTWVYGGDPGKLLAVAWACATASHVLIFFSTRPAMLLGSLAPLIACGAAAVLTSAGGLPLVTALGLLAGMGAIAVSGFVGEDRRNLIAALSKARAAQVEAEAATEAKTRFLGLVSHELRTPLNAIIGYAELIADSGDAHVDDAMKIGAAAHRLLHVINGMLDVSQIEAGIGGLVATRGAVRALLTALEPEAAIVASAHGNRFTLKAAADLGEATLDWARLQGALLHLVENAAKFTRGGAIDLTVRRAFRKGRDVVEFAVRDTGAGIAPENLDTIFEPFVQADATSARRHGGAGLGLALARLTARAMGGDVACESRPGAGSTFTLWVDAGT